MQAVLTALFALCLIAPARAGVDIQHWQTTGGTRVYFIASPALPILDVQVDFAAGSMFDPPGKAGLAALTRGVLDLGAADLDENAIADRLADVGATLSGGADTDRASLSLRTLVAADKRGPALELLRKLLAAPRFDPAIFERERARTVAALKESLTRPDTLAGQAFWTALYPDHPYGRQATPASLAALSLADLRAFHQRHYHAANARITLVGQISRAQAAEWAETLAAALPPGAPADLPAPPQAGTRTLVSLKHPATQAHIHIGLPGVERGHPDFFPLLVGNYTLGGGGFVSRLMQEVRDKRGYAYGVSSRFSFLRQAGPFQISLQTKRSQAREALKVVRVVLDGFLRDGPSEDELAAAKANLSGSFPLRLDSNQKLLENAALIGFYDLPLDYLDRYPQQVEAVTAEQVRKAFARHVRPDALVTVLVAAE